MGLSHLMERPKESVAHHSIRLGIITTLGSWICTTCLTDVYFQRYANSLTGFWSRFLASPCVVCINCNLSPREHEGNESGPRARRLRQEEAILEKNAKRILSAFKSSRLRLVTPSYRRPRPSLSQSRPHMSTLRRKNPLLGRMMEMFSLMKPAKKTIVVFAEGLPINRRLVG